jgi:hypothetical protein
MLSMTYQAAKDNFKIDFGMNMAFPKELLDKFFSDAVLIGAILVSGMVFLNGVECSEEQWTAFLRFRWEAEKGNQVMFQRLDAEITEFLMFASRMRPCAPA